LPGGRGHIKEDLFKREKERPRHGSSESFQRLLAYCGSLSNVYSLLLSCWEIKPYFSASLEDTFIFLATEAEEKVPGKNLAFGASSFFSVKLRCHEEGRSSHLGPIGHRQA
jgi:hypothetical protein